MSPDLLTKIMDFLGLERGLRCLVVLAPKIQKIRISISRPLNKARCFSLLSLCSKRAQSICLITSTKSIMRRKRRKNRLKISILKMWLRRRLYKRRNRKISWRDSHLKYQAKNAIQEQARLKYLLNQIKLATRIIPKWFSQK
jgi:hypothetical protein